MRLRRWQGLPSSLVYVEEDFVILDGTGVSGGGGVFLSSQRARHLSNLPKESSYIRAYIHHTLQVKFFESGAAVAVAVPELPERKKRKNFR